MSPFGIVVSFLPLQAGHLVLHSAIVHERLFSQVEINLRLPWTYIGRMKNVRLVPQLAVQAVTELAK